MQVDVRDGLSGRRAAVGDHPKILEPLFLGHLRRHDHQVAEDARVLARRRPEPAQPIPPPRDDEAVGGRGGGDVLLLVDFLLDLWNGEYRGDKIC